MKVTRAVLALALLGGCGREVPAGGVRPPSQIAAAVDLIPEDLDLVLRVDLARMRSSLGDDATAELLARAAAEDDSPLATPQPLLQRALAGADVVWLALRVADADAGDRVVIVRPTPHRDDDEAAHDWSELPPGWKRQSTETADVARLLQDPPPRRDGTERIFLVGDEPTAVFVSPVEAMSVERVLERGPDPRRGQPDARGIVSLDYRAGRLGERWSSQFPSLAGLWRGVERIIALVDVRGDALELDARIRCKRPDDAARLLRFLETIRSASLEGDRFRDLLEPLTLSQNEHTITLAWSLPSAAIAAILANRTAAAPAPDAPSEPLPPD